MNASDIEANNRAFNELKSVLESKIAHLSESKEKMEKIDKDLDALEVKNQALVKQLQDEKTAREELKAQIDNLEKAASRIGNGKTGDESKKLEIKKALNTFIRRDIAQKTREEMEHEVKYLRTDNDPSGGYLTPPEWFLEILKKITEVSPIRQYARIVQTSRESLMVPVRENILTGNWVGEAIQYPKSNSNYGIRELKVNGLSVTSEVTIQMIQDSIFNVEDQIMMDISESFAATEGAAYVVGDGVNKPQGILTGAGTAQGIQLFNSGLAADFDGDNIVDIAGQLKQGYDPYYMCNRRTLAYIRKLKDGIGQYLWTPGLANVYPSTINGHPYISAIDVPDVGAGNIPLIFGDFKRGYMIVDHINMYLIRDNFTKSDQGIIRFNALRRVGGMVVLAEAIKAIKCSV